MFKALGDASRLRIVELLDQDEASVSDLAVHLRISLPAVLQHLGVLEHVGLISTHKAGRTRRCRLEPAGLGPAEHPVRFPASGAARQANISIAGTSTV